MILINPQYAPKILAKPDVGHAVDVITATARDDEVGLFDRFAVMRYWVETEQMPFEQFLSPDGLHMNDWSYACIAKLLATAILDGTKLPPATAVASRRASMQAPSASIARATPYPARPAGPRTTIVRDVRARMTGAPSRR